MCAQRIFFTNTLQVDVEICLAQNPDIYRYLCSNSDIYVLVLRFRLFSGQCGFSPDYPIMWCRYGAGGLASRQLERLGVAAVSGHNEAGPPPQAGRVPVGGLVPQRPPTRPRQGHSQGRREKENRFEQSTTWSQHD